MPDDSNLTGSILVAHPSLVDPSFRRTLVFLSQHSAEEGATGFVLNRPLGESLGKLPGLPDVPVYFGGPVQPEQIVLASLQWRENPTVVAFRAFVGRIGEDALDKEWLPGLRAFAGCSGWSPQQLEREIAENAWLVVPPSRDIIEMHHPAEVWKQVMRRSGPMFHLLSELPDDPSKN